MNTEKGNRTGVILQCDRAERAGPVAVVGGILAVGTVISVISGVVNFFNIQDLFSQLNTAGKERRKLAGESRILLTLTDKEKYDPYRGNGWGKIDVGKHQVADEQDLRPTGNGWRGSRLCGQDSRFLERAYRDLP